MDVRHNVHPEDAKHYTTQELRNRFLIQELFVKNEVKMVYSHIDRMITGGVYPVEPVVLQAGANMGVDYFLERREIGIINVGNAGSVVVDGVKYDLNTTDGLYIGMGSKEVSFSSADAKQPAKFYLTVPRLIRRIQL